jgi:hypothetical protein
MNWEEVGAIGQMLGSIAVFITLVYLAVQIQHARQEVQRNLGKVSIDSAQDVLLLLAANPSLSAIYVKGNATLGVPPGPLTQMLIERAGLTVEEASVFNYLQLAWFQHRVQVIPYLDSMIPAQRISFEKATRGYFGMPLHRMWYEGAKEYLHDDAVRYIDNLLAQPG